MISKLWDEIVQHLNGSCNSLTQTLDLFGAEYLEDDMEFLEYLDSEIFCCETCGWWSELSELGHNESAQTCIDCEREENEY